MENQEPKTILLVEDDTVTAMVETQLLKSFGYAVVAVKSGEAAVQIAAGNDKIALVLMDINLGSGMDGTEAARQILVARKLPIVFITAHTGKEYIERIKGIAGYGCIVKNAGYVVLQSSIEMALNLFEAEEVKMRQLDELRRWQVVTLGREGRIGDLKREVNALAARLGEKPRYGSAESLQ